MPENLRQAIETSQERIKNLSREVAPENYFHIAGQSIRSVTELASILDQVDENTFLHHAKNGDFSRWIKEVFNDTDLAAEAKEAKDRRQLQLAIYRHIANYD